MRKRYGVLGGLVLSVVIGAHSVPVQAACNHLQGSQYLDCIGPVIDRTLNKIDPPWLRALREACQQGNGRACELDTGVRTGRIRNMNLVIDYLKRQR
jgi:hypothetical protein